MIQKHNRRDRGFTLIELMVAVAVMAILFLLFFQIISSIGSLTARSANQLDSLSQGRLVLDRVGLDLDARVRDPQVPVLFVKNKGNDEFAFYSESNRETSVRLCHLVGYRVANGVLDRAATSVTWDASRPLLFMPETLSLPATGSYQNLSDSIFRLEVLFLLYDSNLLTSLAPSDWSNVAAVIVGIVALDTNSRKILSAAQLDALANAFPDAVDGKTLLDIWMPVLTDVPSLIPPKAAAGVRVYQRIFYVR